MKPTSNPLTIIKQRSVLPLMKKAYTKNIETWFDKKPKPANNSDTLVGMILQSGWNDFTKL